MSERNASARLGHIPDPSNGRRFGAFTAVDVFDAEFVELGADRLCRLESSVPEFGDLVQAMTQRDRVLCGPSG
jgi:hypothetical protein